MERCSLASDLTDLNIFLAFNDNLLTFVHGLLSGIRITYSRPTQKRKTVESSYLMYRYII